MSDPKTVEQPVTPPVAKIVSTAPRETMVPLAFPVEFDSTLYEEIRLRRVSGKEVEVFMTKMTDKTVDFVVPPWIDCPVEVWDALDDDDRFTLDQEAKVFTPRRLLEMFALASASGAASSGS